MKKAVSLLFCAGLAFVLAGCPRPYPLEITHVGDTPDYPLQAAGFTREKILSYRADDSLPGDNPDLSDVSIAYDLLTPGAQIASTIYVTHAPTVYPGLLEQNDPLKALFEGNKSTIVQHRPGAELLGEVKETLTRNGRKYTALVATYRFNGVFMRKQQTVYSVLMVWRHEDNFIKLRSTTPYSQRKPSRQNNLNLLNAVNWTAPP